MSITAALIGAAGIVAPLVDKVPADKNVKAGWLGAVVFVGLALAVVFLAFSLVKHLRRAEKNLAPKDEDDAEKKVEETTADPADHRSHG